jgi:hypothetical protein
VDRDGDLLWGGIIWTTRYSAASATLEIGASDFLSYFERRRVLDHPILDTGVITHTNVDQLAIAIRLIERAQAHPGGDVGVEVRGPQVSGVTRTVSYGAGELKPVADALRDLANADRGFDFTMDVEYGVDGQPVRFLSLGYPRLGQPGAPHVWEYGANMIDFTWPVDAASMATRVFAQGSSSEGGPVLRFAEDSGAHLDGWPLLEDGASQLDTGDAALVEAQARGELGARRRPVVLPELIVRADLDPVVGTYSVGDDVRLVLDDPFFAGEQADVTLRLLGFEVTPGNDADLEEVTLTVTPAVGTS